MLLFSRETVGHVSYINRRATVLTRPVNFETLIVHIETNVSYMKQRDPSGRQDCCRFENLMSAITPQ